jgi:hypothetical protein
MTRAISVWGEDVSLWVPLEAYPEIRSPLQAVCVEGKEKYW